MHSDTDTSISNEPRTSSASSKVNVQTNARARGLLADVAGDSSSQSDVRTQAPGSMDDLRESGMVTSETPSAKSHVVSRQSSHLPTPQSLGNMASYLLTRTPMSQSSQPDPESMMLPTEFRSHESPSSPCRPHSIPTPDPSPLAVRTRGSEPYSFSQGARTNSDDDNECVSVNKRDGSRSSASAPPRTPSRQLSTRPVTPVLQTHPTTLQRRQTERLSPAPSRSDNLHPNDSTTNPLQRLHDEIGGETVRIRAQVMKSHPASTRTAELGRSDHFKRVRRLAPSNRAGGATLTSDLGGQDGSLLWSSANVGVIDSPAKGKRIALFQETSDESFEESLAAGGYGRYRSDGPWKLEEDAELPSQSGDATGEEEHGSGLAMSEEEKRKKNRLAAFFDPPRAATPPMQLFPVEIEGCGRVLMKVEPPEPQTPSKPNPKVKRSRKRKKASADTKHGMDKDSTGAAAGSVVDGPNWPDLEFPWRSRLAQDSLSSAEREGRLRYIESFFDRDSDEDDVEEGRSFLNRRNVVEVPSRNPRLGRGKMYPLVSHSKGRRRGTTTTVIPSDPADARIALLSKKSIRAVQLRLLRRRDAKRGVDKDDGQVLCVCQGRDDGRPLVQCDACRRWYHLQCIGIQSTSELGREEDPWFCANCAEVKTPPPVVAPLPEPTLVRTDGDANGIRTSVEGHDPPFLNAGLNPSPAMPWTRTVRLPMTPPRTQYAPHTSSRSSWDEPPSSSSHGDPRTPHFNTASAFGDTVRVYGMASGRSPEASSSNVIDESPFDPTSTPSRGIRFGLPFTTPKDGRWGTSLWHGVRGSGSGHGLFHTPKHPGEDGGATSSRCGAPLLYDGRVGEVSEEGPSCGPGSDRTSGPNNSTPVERDGLGGLKRMQVLESPLGAKRTRRTVDS